MRIPTFARLLCASLLPAFLLSVSPAGSALAAKADNDYLNANKTKAGVQVTKTGLQYRVLREGNGKSPGPTDEVEVHYKGILVDGRQFDSSYDRGSPARFPLNRVIPGWTEGLQLMKEGAKYEFVIPSSLGYGTMGAGNSIPPNATLIFEVELLKVH
jgi:FKBP-type peptidyl-prolyl cis-trans isomerase